MLFGFLLQLYGFPVNEPSDLPMSSRCVGQLFLGLGLIVLSATVAAAFALRTPARRGKPGPTPVADLLGVCKDACDEISVLVEEVYTNIVSDPAGNNGVRKEDLSYLSLADGIVQVRPQFRVPHWQSSCSTVPPTQASRVMANPD